MAELNHSALVKALELMAKHEVAKIRNWSQLLY